MAARDKMPRKRAAKLIVDAAMAVLLLLQMAQQLLPQGFHELSGIGLGVLFVVHNLLNLRWYAQLRRGRWTAARVAQTVVNACCLALLVLMLASGIGMSELMTRLGVEFPGVALMRRVHMTCVYASLVVMSFHLGLHGRMVLGLLRGYFGSLAPSRLASVFGRAAAAAVSAYGVYAFAKLNLWGYLSGGTEFAFMDASVPLPVFLADYAAVMALAACLGHCLAQLIGERRHKGSKALAR